MVSTRDLSCIFKIRFTKAVRFLAVNGVSLGIALVANLALSLNMARRVSFSVAQPMTVTGWMISSFLLIALVAYETHQVNQPQNADRVLTQAFYYAIIAATIYFILSLLMFVTIFGAVRGHYSREFHLTASQRTLMLQTISFMVYLIGGAAVFARIEKWRFLDSVYWADNTLLTIGIGNLAPMTHLGRGLLFPYAYGGILILGLLVGSMRSLMLERGKKQMTARLMEKTRRHCVRKIQSGHNRRFALPNIDEDGDMSEWDRRKQEFETMRAIKKRAATKKKWLLLGLSMIAWIVLWLVGGLAFVYSEEAQKWTYFDALYFAFTTLLTIGYGDLYPESKWGKPFFVLWSLLAVPTLTILISSMGDTIFKAVSDVTIYLGELTILPGEKHTKRKFKRGLRRVTRKTIQPKNGHSKAPLTSDDRQGSARPTLQDSKDGLKSVRSVHKRAEIRRQQHHCYLLARELQSLYRTMQHKPNKRYGYDEWAYYLALIGEDEAEIEFHQEAMIKEPHDKRHEGSSPHEKTDYKPRHGRWSWIGPGSPLMGEKEETEWLLEALARRLEQILKEHLEQQDN